jgi:acyl-CoA reductase-like NAD-dependent aldehyde dehydrogenase
MGKLTGFARARLLRRLGDIIAGDADALAEVETRDTGKLLREMRGQLASIPEWFYYFAGLADKLQGATIPSDKPNFLVYTRREPAGVIAHALRAGTVWINAYRVVGPDVPFGGFGLSGLGRENGIDAVHEYTQTKAIWVELTGGTRDPFTLG